MSDFAFLEKPAPVRSRQQQVNDLRREFFKTKLKGIANYVEQAEDYCRDLINAGADVTEELNELEATGTALALVARLLRKAEEDKRNETTILGAG